MPEERRWTIISGLLTALSVYIDWVLVLAGLAGFALYTYWGGDREARLQEFLKGFYTGLGLMVLYWLLRMLFPG